jgi:hypothetical protein
LAFGGRATNVGKLFPFEYRLASHSRQEIDARTASSRRHVAWFGLVGRHILLETLIHAVAWILARRTAGIDDRPVYVSYNPIKHPHGSDRKPTTRRMPTIVVTPTPSRSFLRTTSCARVFAHSGFVSETVGTWKPSKHHDWLTARSGTYNGRHALHHIGVLSRRRRASNAPVLIRIVQQPPRVLMGVTLSEFQVGRVYDVGTSLAQYLIVEGFAVAEMRSHPDRHDANK